MDNNQSASCNICGGTEFSTGPGGRLSATGLPPLCICCQSLERHRTLRRFYDRIRQSLDFPSFDCLQISTDRCIEPDWFATHALSIFNEYHSLDIQNLQIASHSYGIVICNHVLEHVRDDVQAMSELIRIVDNKGFLQIGVPDPARMSSTRDWGEPDWSDHGHYRKYGIDILSKFELVIDKLGILLLVPEFDPVTGMEDLFFLYTRNPEVANHISEAVPNTKVALGTVGSPAEGAVRDAAVPPVLHPAHRLRAPDRFHSYVVQRRHRELEGWVNEGALSATIVFDGVQRQIGVHGHVAEIGVHHGRFFLALSLLRQLGEKSLAIDVFDLQEFNVDKSGLGDLQIFEKNVQTWLGKEPDVVVWKMDSMGADAGSIRERLKGPVRLFSVDGSHTVENTLNDIRLAEASIAPGGIVIIDDFLNPAWPGCVEAVVQYLGSAHDGSRLVPIGYGDNKFYLTSPEYVQHYWSALDLILTPILTARKKVTFCGFPAYHFGMPEPAQLLAVTPMRANATLNFDSDDRAAAMIGQKEQPRRGGTWAVGEWSGMALSLPGDDAGASLKLALTIACFRHQEDREPEIEVFAGDRRLGSFRFPPGEDSRNIEFELRRKDLGRSGRLEIWFRNPGARSPQSLGLSKDTRVLSHRIVSAALTG